MTRKKLAAEFVLPDLIGNLNILYQKTDKELHHTRTVENSFLTAIDREPASPNLLFEREKIVLEFIYIHTIQEFQSTEPKY